MVDTPLTMEETVLVRKKVKLNLKVQYMDDDNESDERLVVSPDLDKLDGDGDYMCQDQDNNSGDDSDDEDSASDADDEGIDEFGPTEYRDPTDKRFILGLELRHFGLETTLGMDTINLRSEETSLDETILHDNLELGLLNALKNSSKKTDKRKDKQPASKGKGKKKVKENKAAKNKLPSKKKLRLSKKAKDTKRRADSSSLKELIKETVDQMDVGKSVALE